MTDPTRPPATGYPAQPTNGYPPPPQQQSNYYYPNHNPYQAPPPGTQYYPPPRATFFRRLISFLIFFFIVMGVILFIIWLVLRPRIPSFTVTSLSLTSLNLNSSPSSTISATWSANFSVYNPNHKLHVYYDEIETRIFYRSILLAVNQLPPFDQATKTLTNVSATIGATSAYIDPSLAASLRDDHSKGTVKFNVQVLALVRFKSGSWTARRRFLRAFCDDLPLNVPAKASNGSLTGGSRRCAVGI